MENMKEKIQVSLKDNKYPYLEDKNIDITNIGSRVRGKIIYISSRFTKDENNEKFVEFERINEFTIKLQNAKLTDTEKGTLVIKYEPNVELYLIEIPSGYRGGVYIDFMSGICKETTILQSERGSLGEVKHIWCSLKNDDKAEIDYKITGRTGTAGYGRLRTLFGESLSGTVTVKNGEVKISEDEELDKLIE